MTRVSARTDVDAVLHALADTTRRSLLVSILATPGLTTSQLAARTRSISRWGVIKHLAVLRDAGLIQTMANGRLRRHYVEKAALEPVRSWLDEMR